MTKVLGLIALVLLLVNSLDAEPRKAGRKRDGKILSMFQLVTFPNDPCVGGSKNGTCYTAAECSSRGGTNAGSCASGYGVCCTITVNCGATSSENCTYFDSNVDTAGGCQVQICPCSNDICQIRLDFTNFVIAGPSTRAASDVDLTKGQVASTATGTKSASTASQCRTDTFTLSGGSGGPNPPTICGRNIGEHMYMDMSGGTCANLAFQLGSTAVGIATIPGREWSIKVTQYSCSYTNLAPSGCTQFFFGPTSGNVQTFNYQNGSGQHLANQDQTICIRKERLFCRVCFYAVINTDFQISGPVGAAAAFNGKSCCGYTPVANAINGYDCVNIPGAENTAKTQQPSFICGRSSGLKTAAAGKSVCTQRTPFYVRFRSDGYEYAVSESTATDPGFTLGYTLDTICSN